METIEQVEVESFQSGKIKGRMTLRLNNPNPFAVTVKSAQFEIWANNIKMGEAGLDNSFKIDAKQTRSYPISMTGDARSALSGGISGLLGMLAGNDPKIFLKGDIEAESYFVKRKVPLEFDTGLKMSDFIP